MCFIESGNGDWPLGALQLRRLVINQRQLVELIEPGHGLVDDLAASGCITSQQRQAVLETGTTANRNRKLLDIMSRRSVAHFDRFIAGLVNNGQPHVAKLLTGDGGRILRFFPPRTQLH